MKTLKLNIFIWTTYLYFLLVFFFRKASEIENHVALLKIEVKKKKCLNSSQARLFIPTFGKLLLFQFDRFTCTSRTEFSLQCVQKKKYKKNVKSRRNERCAFIEKTEEERFGKRTIFPEVCNSLAQHNFVTISAFNLGREERCMCVESGKPEKKLNKSLLRKFCCRFFLDSVIRWFRGCQISKAPIHQS